MGAWNIIERDEKPEKATKDEPSSGPGFIQIGPADERRKGIAGKAGL